MTTEQIERRDCARCGEPTTPIPSDLIGVYETPVGEEYAAYPDDYLHRECAEAIIEEIRNGEKQQTVADYTEGGDDDQ